MPPFHHNFPLDFIHQMNTILGEEETNELLLSLTLPHITSVRINSQKRMHQDLFPSTTTNRIPWCTNGFYLEERPNFTFDPYFHAGAYYVQEASSMFIAYIYHQLSIQPKRVLDLCAAPGGKTTLLRSLLPDTSLLVANEPIKNRSMILAENVAKWGHPNVLVTSAYGKDFSKLNNFFDLILADVPCSGEGMFRKDAQAIKEWDLENVLLCANRQKEIIADVWPALQPGGYLIYSTCTFNEKENEENAQWICDNLGADMISLDFPSYWNISNNKAYNLPFYHFYPHKTKGEGFSCILLQKHGKFEPTALKEKPIKWKKTHQLISPIPYHWVNQPNDFIFHAPQQELLCALPKSNINDFLKIATTIHTLRMGIELANYKGKQWQPRTELALSTALNQQAFPISELNLEQALRFLRKESFTISNKEKGFVLVTYRDFPLGFVKNLGNRVNNLYPTEWKIRSELTSLK